MIFYFTKNRNLHIFFFFFFFGGGGGGGGVGMKGVVWWREGSAARVSEIFLQIIQIKKKKYHHPIPCS